MLTDYIPDGYGGQLGDHLARAHLRGRLDDINSEPRSLRHNNLTAYISEFNHPALSARCIVDSIDWHSLPETHQLKPKRDGTGWTPHEWDLISTYARIRGSAAHALQSAPADKEASQTLQEEITKLEHVDNPDEMYRVVSEWSGSRDMMPPDGLQTINQTPTQELINTCKDETRCIEDNWHRAARHHNIHPLLNEARIIVKIDDVLYCSSPDQISHINDSPQLPPAMYNIDAKSTEKIHPKHIIQAETQRRAVASRVSEDEPVHAILIRLGLEKEDWDIHTSLDDDWPAEKAWDMFRRRAETLYNDGLVQAELSQLE